MKQKQKAFAVRPEIPKRSKKGKRAISKLFALTQMQ